MRKDKYLNGDLDYIWRGLAYAEMPEEQRRPMKNTGAGDHRIKVALF